MIISKGDKAVYIRHDSDCKYLLEIGKSYDVVSVLENWRTDEYLISHKDNVGRKVKSWFKHHQFVSINEWREIQLSKLI